MNTLFQSRVHCFPSPLIAGKLERRHYLSGSASRSSSRTTTVERGNAFEQRSLDLLGQTMSMSLTCVGGKEDGGIDLLGWWWLPHNTDDSRSSNLSSTSDSRRRIRVIGQCKAERKKMGPSYVRELEGVLFRFSTMSQEVSDLQLFPFERSPTPVVALLISESAFTKSAILRAQSSPIPFLLLHLPPVEDLADSLTDVTPTVPPKIQVGNVGTALCNPALSGSKGLLEGQLEIRWERHPLGHGGRPALWWNFEKLQNYVPSPGSPKLSQLLESDSQSPS